MNIEAIRAVAARIRALKPIEYNQEELGVRTTCGTAACIAGHTVLEAGAVLVFPEGINEKWSWNCQFPGGPELDTWMEAVKLLDLDAEEADSLFDGDPGTSWPEPWGEQYEDAPVDKRHLIAADLLDAIADGKVKL